MASPTESALSEDVRLSEIDITLVLQDTGAEFQSGGSDG